MTTKTTGRAVLYGRVSQDVQRDNYSIPTQIAACLGAAGERGYNVVGSNQYVNADTGRDVAPGAGAIPAFVDDYSGTELLRPAVLAMLEFLRTEGADAVFVLSLDRLARDPYIRETLEREIEATGARVFYVQGGYAESPEGEIHKDLDGAFAKWENMKRVERSVRGKIGKAQRGLFVVGAPPYGYELDKSAKGGLKINEDAAAVVRRIFAMYAEDGRTLREIARTLNAERVPSPRGATWSNATLHVLLHNETYAGRAHYNMRASLIVGDGITKVKRRKTVKRDPSEVISIAVAPIVDGVTFERVQRKLDYNRETIRKRPRRFYLLSGMVFCAKCKRRYTVQTEPARKGRVEEARQYRHRQSDGHCEDHMISARKLEPQVWEGIVKVMLDPVKLALGREESLAARREKLAQAHEHLETLRRNMAKMDKRKAGFQRMYADGDMTRAEYQKERVELDRERGELAAQVKELEENLAALPSESDLADLQAFAEDIRRVFAAGDVPDTERRAILENMNVRIEINADRSKAKVEGIFKAFDISLLSTSCLYNGQLPVTFFIDLTA